MRAAFRSVLLHAAAGLMLAGAPAHADLPVAAFADPPASQAAETPATLLERHGMPAAKLPFTGDLNTDAALAARALATGLVDPDDLPGVHFDRRAPPAEAPVFIGDGAGLAAWLENFAPSDPLYRPLLDERAKLAALADRGGWPAFSTKAKLKRDMRHADVPALRRRLEASGDLLPTSADADLFSDDLFEALRAFQARNGLEPDGVVGRQTARLLGLPVEAVIAKIDLNLERLRWQRPESGLRLRVNVAAMELYVLDDDGFRETIPVVVGTPKTKTPMLTDIVRGVEFAPYWYPPKGIRAELEREKGAAWFRKNGFEPISFGSGLRQRPGPANALGRVKFLTANRFDIYLHDTNSRSLFGKSARAFSHGCVRIGDPDRLASILLGREGWDEGRVTDAMAGRNKRVTFDRSVPLILDYLTAWVDADGGLQLRLDIYGRDADLAAAGGLRAPGF